MNISGLGGGSPPLKIEPDTTVAKDSNRPENKLVNRSLQQPDGADQRIESRVASVRQQVSGTTDNTESSEAESPPRKPKVSNDLNYAFTKLGIKEKDSSESEEEKSNERSERSNRQSRAGSTQVIDSRDVTVRKDPIQF